ncbi:hypothetical protein L3N51_02152 [Metallosphaera sp. J1]|uniref:hypothetical protein n=1 Tax=Metallosphaera javensis (ex Hofmann et al. 2022) TaxID=99938 RepID=UPI001EDF9DA0|nr:hypothetical protein [Metallosphaera javensis (ex Hofmann et al. 2022)]MCG3109856.1 hypothetical protein [Metallosphaera javensis (ex Hofmann et al. 2022)]
MSERKRKSNRHPCFMDKGLHVKLDQLASSKRMSLYDYTNYLLSNALEIEASGVNLNQVKELIIVLGKISQSYKGTITIAPFSMTGKEGEWRDLGKRLGIIAKESFQNSREGVMRMCKFLLEIFGQVQEGDNYVKVLSPNLMSETVTNNLKELLEGLLESSAVKGMVIHDKGVLGLKMD